MRFNDNKIEGEKAFPFPMGWSIYDLPWYLGESNVFGIGFYVDMLDATHLSEKGYYGQARKKCCEMLQKRLTSLQSALE